MPLPDRVVWPVLAAASGLAAGLGQAPWGLWPLAVLGYAAGLAIVGNAKRPALLGWIMGVAHFALVLHWIVEPFLVDAEATGWLAPVALAGMAGGMALFWAAGLGLGARLAGPLGAALGLAAAELCRAYLLTGFPWALPGHVLIASPALPSAAILGAHGLGLCLLLGAGLLATMRAVPAAVGATALALPFLLSVAVPTPPPQDGTAPIVRLVQPNAPQHLKWDPDFVGIFFRRGLAATAAPAETAPALILWPETSLPALLGTSDDLRPIVANAAGGAAVLLGAQRYDPTGAPRNAAALLTGLDGEITHVYDKHRLVPFGEYLPLPRLFGLVGIGPMAARLAGRYAPGPGPELIDVPDLGPVLPLICYEAIFPQDLRRVARPRAILHLTNDAWFGTGAGPRQHLALARLRAAETGLPVLRAANTGISAAIDARGRLLASLPLGAEGHLDVPLPPATPSTPYLATGDWPPVAVVLLGLGLLLLRRRKVVDVGVAAP